MNKKLIVIALSFLLHYTPAIAGVWNGSFGFTSPPILEGESAYSAVYVTYRDGSTTLAGTPVRIEISGSASINNFEIWGFNSQESYSSNSRSRCTIYASGNGHYISTWLPKNNSSSIEIRTYDDIEITGDRELTLTIDNSAAYGLPSYPNSSATILIVDDDNVDARLVNMSSRGYLTNGGVFNGGIIIEGNTPQMVLVAASGPRLAQVGVPDALPDPLLVLSRPGVGEIARNNNWNAQTLPPSLGNGLVSMEINAAVISQKLTAMGMNVAQMSLDSALLVELEPGAYIFRIYANASSTPQGNTMITVWEID